MPGRCLAVRSMIVQLAAGDWQPLDVGAYAGQHDAPVRSDVRCPYCREPMMETQPTGVVHRIVRIKRRYVRGRRALVAAHEIPATHRVLGCASCRVAFTLPKEP